MKKILSFIILTASLSATAQISFAGKANLIFPTGSASWKNIKNTAVQAYDENGKTNAGFNVGVSVRVSLPGAFFLMPELYYTTFKNKFTEPITKTELEAKSNRIDVPVLLGYNLLGKNLGAFIGPVASYNLSKDNQWKDFKENAATEFTVGYQLGLQAQIKNLIINARYEGAISKDTRKFFNSTINETVEYDNRPSLLLLGLGYEF